MKLAYWLGGLLFCALGNLHAATAAKAVDKKIRPAWLDAHLKVLYERPAKNAVDFVFDNNIWLPGEGYINGSKWLALNCTAEKCTFEPATLRVKKELWQGHYDEHPTKGQKLTFKKDAASSGKVIAWFALPARKAWVMEGDVPTYYSTEQPLNRPNTQGTYEALITLPNGGESTLVPMAFNAKKFFGLNENAPSDAVFLQLRSESKRQLLLSTIGDCDGYITDRYLQWVGDLDRDGKADYLISFIDADGPVHLYLSSYAAKGQLVGLAAVHDSPPYGGECDGGGWAFEPDAER
jgi:hypothetical protein